MKKVGKMFECVCGKISYGDNAPEECPSCKELDSFIELPDEIVKEREEDMINDEELTEYDEKYE